MKDETPFNPALPPDLNLPPHPKPKAKTKNQRRKRPGDNANARSASTKDFVRNAAHKTKAAWQRIKTQLRLRLARLDAAQLKRLLIACGIAATVALIILALAKHTALIIVLLAVLGAVVVLKLWNRMLTLGI